MPTSEDNSVPGPLFAAPFGQAPRFGEPPFECDAAGAQAFCAFPVVVPAELPDGTAVTKVAVRPEGPQQGSGLHVTIAGGSRRLRLDQYHHDWWRPTSSTTNLRRVQGASRAGPHVVFWGRDERGRPAACATLGRTQVEVRIERGTFVELELARLYAGLHLARQDVLPSLQELPFHRLSYHVRAGRGPRGLDELAAARWVESLDTLAAASRVPVLLPAPLPTGWRFDSGATWPAPPPEQTQWLLCEDGPFGPTVVFYARARPLDDAQPLKLPPSLHAQEGWRARARLIRHRRGWVAQQSSALGGWTAAWSERALGAAYQVFVRAGVLPDMDAFVRLVESMRSERET